MALLNFNLGPTDAERKQRLLKIEDERRRKREQENALIVNQAFSGQEIPSGGVSVDQFVSDPNFAPIEDISQLTQQQQALLNNKLIGVGNTGTQISRLLEPFTNERELVEAQGVANQANINARDAAEIIASAKQDKIIQDRTQSIRKERQVAIKPFVSSINSIGQGIESLQSASGAGDLVGIVSLLKAIDPTSVAREGEVNAVANAAGLIESITGKFNKAIGDGQLSDKARTQLIDQMMLLLNRASTNAEGIDKRFSNDAKASGVNPLRLRTNSSLFDEDNKIIRPTRNKTQAQLAAEELARRGR